MEIQAALPVAALAVDPLVAGAAEAHEVCLLVAAAFCEREYMVDFLHVDVASFLQALLAERVLSDVAVADPFPRPAVALAGRVAALELLVVPLHLLCVLLAVDAVGQDSGSRESGTVSWVSLA